MPICCAWLATALGVAELVELHLQGLLAGREGVGLALQRRRRERRLLHRGVEEQQPHDAADQHQADQGHERDLRARVRGPRDDGEARPLDGLLGDAGDAADLGRAGLLIG